MNNENSFNVLNPLFFVVDPTVDIPKPKVESLQSQQECNSSQLRWSWNFCVVALICGLPTGAPMEPVCPNPGCVMGRMTALMALMKWTAR